ncbi:MAG: DUF427 domain-containing protein [Bryobacter sp.]|nr:DUF427 domain-containing protein [Bryobacter sp.]
MPSLAPESVWDYPRPPRLEPVPQEIRIVLAGITIAQTSQAMRILETSHPPTYYLPPDAFLAGVLRPAAGQSFCEWKGVARYWDLITHGKVSPKAGWSYDTPSAPYQALAGYVAVYASRVDACFVGDEEVIPQPGNFYGGWITSNLTGPFKG